MKSVKSILFSLAAVTMLAAFVFPQLSDERRVTICSIPPQRKGACGGWEFAGLDVVLDQHGNAKQRSATALASHFVCLDRVVHCVGIDGQNGSVFLVIAIDSIKIVFGERATRELPRLERSADFHDVASLDDLGKRALI